MPEHIEATIEAVKEVGVPALLLYPNNDAGAGAIIKSIENTKKVTHAMELVAAAKMRKAQILALAGRPYSSSLHEILSSVQIWFRCCNSDIGIFFQLTYVV